MNNCINRRFENTMTKEDIIVPKPIYPTKIKKEIVQKYYYSVSEEESEDYSEEESEEDSEEESEEENEEENEFLKLEKTFNNLCILC